MGRRKGVPLFVYQKKCGGAAPIIAMGAKAMIPIAKTLAVKSLPLIKSGAMKIAPTIIPIIGEKIGKKTINSKSMQKAEQMLINNVQSNLQKRIRGNSFQKRRLTRALINSL